MKEPKKPTGEELQKIIAKRKPKRITVYKSVPRGTLATVIEAATDFAIKESVPTTDVRFSGGGYDMYIRRLENDDEKAKRVRMEEGWKFQQAMNVYRHWQDQQARVAAVEKSRPCCSHCSCQRP